jgi:hypothetical protein
VLHRVLSFEDLIELLESAVLSLGHHEIEDGRLDGVPDNENDVSLPLDLGKGDRPGELVEQATGVDSEGRESHALGAHLERKHFDRVQSLERCETDGIDCAENEDHSDGGASGGAVGLVGLAVKGCGGGDTDPYDARADHGEQHEWAATDAVDECGTSERKNELEACVAEVDVGLGDFVLVASSVQHGGQEVGEHAIAGPLSKDGKDHVCCKTVTASTGIEKRAVVPPALVSALPSIESVQ